VEFAFLKWMADVLFDSGNKRDADVQRVQVEALGEPGQRRFRMMALIDGETYIVWMEKQQLQALGLAIEQLLEQVPDADESLEDSGSITEFDDNTTNQFRVGRIELGYDTVSERVVVSAYDLQQEDDEDAANLVLRLNLWQSAELSTDAATVVSAGRPRCPLCGNPVERDGHVCPQQNGHLPISLDESDLLDDT
jgi:uncharacterized repeat protein (TIGR03847 family)